MGKVEFDIEMFLNDYKPKYNIGTKNKLLGKIIKKTPIFPKEEEDIKEYLKFNEYNDLIEEFYNILKENFDEEACNSFKKNIKELDVKVVRKKFRDKIEESRNGFRVDGVYDGETNSIEIVKDKKSDDDYKKAVIFHELLHMASTKNGNYIGLFQTQKYEKDKYIQIGRMLNEGYTQYLTEEYFTNRVTPGVYDHEVSLAAGIEKIVGREQMQKCFFNANLLGVINRLNKYEKDYDVIMYIIVGIDTISNYQNEEEREAQAKLLRTMIADIYNTKINEELESEMITEEEYNRRKYLYVDKYIDSGNYYSEKATVRNTDNLEIINDNGIIEVTTKDNIQGILIPDIEKRKITKKVS